MIDMSEMWIEVFYCINQFNVILIIFQMIFVNIKVCMKRFLCVSCLLKPWSRPKIVKFYWEIWKIFRNCLFDLAICNIKTILIWPMLGFKNGASCYLGAHLVFSNFFNLAAINETLNEHPDINIFLIMTISLRIFSKRFMVFMNSRQT